jgi:hypothetical protein
MAFDRLNAPRGMLSVEGSLTPIGPLGFATLLCIADCLGRDETYMITCLNLSSRERKAPPPKMPPMR